MNEELTARIRSTENCVVHVKPVNAGTTEKSLAGLLWRTTGVAFSEKDISVRINEKTGEGGALILCSRETVAAWLHACLNPTIGMTVTPAVCDAPQHGPHQEKKTSAF
jgi:hypothetical protein